MSCENAAESILRSGLMVLVIRDGRVMRGIERVARTAS